MYDVQNFVKILHAIIQYRTVNSVIVEKKNRSHTQAYRKIVSKKKTVMEAERDKTKGLILYFTLINAAHQTPAKSS